MRRLFATTLVVLTSTLLLAPAIWHSSAAMSAQSSPAVAPSGAYPDSFFTALRWRGIGPNRGGRSIAVAGSPSRTLEYYFGATGGGLWKTTDGGTSWRPVSDKFFTTSSVGAVAVAASQPDIVYVGMGETQLRGNIIQGDGIYKSTDGGKTFAHSGLKDTMAVSRIRIHPTSPDLVYVAALGNPYGPNAERGIFRSRDAGKTWQKVLFRNEQTGGVDISLDPTNPNVVYASLWEVYRTPHSLSSGGPGSGLFKSTDAGTTWTELTRHPGLPKTIVGKIGVAVSPVDANRVYAIIEADEGGVFSSDDAGATWKSVNTERRLRQRAFYYTRIYADSMERDTIYVLNTGLYRSTDAGKTYRTIRAPHGDHHDLWIAPNDPKRMINANDGGANVSVNAGETWTPQTFPTAQMYNVITTARLPYEVCGAQQDNSTACVSSTGNGDSWYAVGGGESGYIAPDPRNPDVFYAGNYGGYLSRLDRRIGQQRTINVWPENPMGHSAKDIAERFQWTFPIVISPIDPKTLYVGSQHVWRSINEGQAWSRISPDLTRHDLSTMGPSGGPITLDQTGVETYATVFSIAPSHQNVNTIWTGSDDGLVHITRDGGKSWENVTPKALPDFARISLVEASPHRLGSAYVAANRYQRNDRAPYVFKTTDYGKTWTKITTGIPADDFARIVREDPKRAGLLYLGTETGIFVSFNDGDSWQSLRRELPVSSIQGIVVEQNDLVIATHGRSFYIMDGIGVLRQLKPEIATSTVHLFQPSDALRGINRSVTIDYYLKNAADKVTIEILDGQGKTIQTLTGAAKSAKEKTEAGPAADDEEGGGNRPAAPRVPVAAGLNRFVWDMRHASATDFPGLIMWSGSTRGPIAPPGKYQVKLLAGGETRTQAFTIKRNPNLPNITDADLQEQFTLASQINRRVTQAHEAVIRIRAIKAQIKDRLDQAKAAKAQDVVTAGDALTGKLTDVEGEIYQYRNQSNQDPLNYPIKLNNKLASLQGVVESTDIQPTEQAYTVFRELSGRLDAQLARLEALLKSDLAPFNTLLQSRQLAPVGP